MSKKKAEITQKILNNRTILKGEKYKIYKNYLNRLSGSQKQYEKSMKCHERNNR